MFSLARGQRELLSDDIGNIIVFIIDCLSVTGAGILRLMVIDWTLETRRANGLAASVFSQQSHGRGWLDRGGESLNLLSACFVKCLENIAWPEVTCNL